MADQRIHQPSRVIIGHCPKCALVVVIFNEYEVWPYVECSCGWTGDTNAIRNSVRYERNGTIRVD